MSKHILSNVEGFVKRGRESFLVDPNCIKVVDGWNKRVDFSGEEDLMAYIKESGLPAPLLVKKTKDNILELVDGERRLRATLRLIAEGINIKSIDINVAPKGTNDIDLCFKSVALNNGKSLLPTEQAAFFKQFESWGVPRQKIADGCGVSLSTVRNRLELYNAGPAVKEAVETKSISIKAAKVIINESDGNIDKQVEKLKVEESTPKVRLKKVNLKPKNFCKDMNCGGISIGGGKCRMQSKSCLFSVIDFIKWFESKDITMIERYRTNTG
jgi:hypothetical protein